MVATLRVYLPRSDSPAYLPVEPSHKTIEGCRPYPRAEPIRRSPDAEIARRILGGRRRHGRRRSGKERCTAVAEIQATGLVGGRRNAGLDGGIFWIDTKRHSHSLGLYAAGKSRQRICRRVRRRAQPEAAR